LPPSTRDTSRKMRDNAILAQAVQISLKIGAGAREEPTSDRE
jgi:hypothetical protein